MARKMLHISATGEKEMKVALTVWESRVSPVFDSARMALIAEVENAVVVNRHYEPLGSELPLSRAVKLSELGVMVLICGAISQLFADMVEAHGIRVVPFITGNVNQVLDAYLKGLLHMPSFQMPGCGMRRRKRFRGGRG